MITASVMKELIKKQLLKYKTIYRSTHLPVAVIMKIVAIFIKLLHPFTCCIVLAFIQQ